MTKMRAFIGEILVKILLIGAINIVTCTETADGSELEGITPTPNSVQGAIVPGDNVNTIKVVNFRCEPLLTIPVQIDGQGDIIVFPLCEGDDIIRETVR